MEQSDTPRTDAAAKRGSDLGGANTMWSGIWPLARDLERELAAATRERDEWQLAAQTEAKMTDLVARERDEARADARQQAVNTAHAFDLVSRVREALGDNGRMMQDELIAHCRTLAGMPAENEKLRAALQAITEESDDEGARECAREALAVTEPKP